MCVLSATAELSGFSKCILISTLFLPGSLCAATSCGCFSYLCTFLPESYDFSLPRQITQSIPHPDTMSLSTPSNCHTAPCWGSLSINNTWPDFLNSWSSSLIQLHVNDLSYDKQVYLQLESHLITYFLYYINRNIYCSPSCVKQHGNYHDGFCTLWAALTWFNTGWLTSPLTQCFPWMRCRQATYEELVDLCHVWWDRRGWRELMPTNWDAVAKIQITQSLSLSTWFNPIPLSLLEWHVCFPHTAPYKCWHKNSFTINVWVERRHHLPSMDHLYGCGNRSEIPTLSPKKSSGNNEIRSRNTWDSFQFNQ